jgi:hypothetical protein
VFSFTCAHFPEIGAELFTASLSTIIYCGSGWLLADLGLACPKPHQDSHGHHPQTHDLRWNDQPIRARDEANHLQPEPYPIDAMMSKVHRG